MIKTIRNTLIDSFLCMMLVGSCAFGLAVAVAPFVVGGSALQMVFAFPFFFVSCVCLIILNNRG